MRKIASPRMTQIVDGLADVDDESLIEPGTMVVTLTRDGYVKRTPLDTFRAQGRGGKGRTGAGTREDDVVEADLRVVAAQEPRQTAEDVVRVPSADETADAILRASRALAEIRAREAEDERAGRDEQLTRWHEIDRAAEDTEGRDAGWTLARDEPDYSPAG